MTAYRALLLYETILREFQKNLADAHQGIEGALESGLGYLTSRLRLTNVGLFWWDPIRNSMVMEYAIHAGALLEGEEEVAVEPDSPLWKLIRERKPIVVSEKRPWIAYLPLTQDDNFVGAVRLERDMPLPRGKILSPLPRFTHPHDEAARDYPLLEDIADILSVKLHEINRDERHRKKQQYLQAGTEVAAAVIETPRLKDMMETVSKSIVKNLGFDRIRFYLVDPARVELFGVLGLQIPGRLLSLENERFALQPETNSLVDSVLAGSIEVSITAGGKVVYVPLIVDGQVVGCMAVDNLLSQQVIDEDQIGALKSLAGQIGMAILNARLFEDIEQQAITDGLTKLYVYRYFQQRLKEEIDRADRYSYSVALIMLDVDHFKSLNDTYGHLMGDKVLELLAGHIRGNIRRIDLAARYGGDEFIILLPEITEQEAWLMGSRLLNTLKQSSLKAPNGELINAVVTLGVAMYPSDAVTGRDLIEAADQALYWAKKNNRGDICFFRTISQKAQNPA
jgi:diguanylate cyclase (GGDEF)-like protein